MNKTFPSFLSLILLVQFSFGADSPSKDVRLYNLEKEYQALKTVVFYPKEALALELKPIVENMLSIYGNVYVNEADHALYITDTPEMVSGILGVLGSLDKKGIKAGNNLMSATIPLQHVLAADIINLVRHKLSKYGTLLNYSDHNALLVTDIESKIDEVRKLVGDLDKPVQHIQIEVVIVEANLEEFKKVGVSVWDWISNVSSQILFRKGAGATPDIAIGLNDNDMHQIPLNSKSATGTVTDRESYTLSAQVSLSDLVSLLSDKGKARVLATPRVVTKNNSMAFIQAMDVIPFKYSPANLPDMPQGNYTPAMLSGVMLQVLPVLQQDSTVHLQLWPSIADLQGWDPKGMPIVFSRTLNTQVSVKTGETFVLGGMRRTETVKKRTGIPLLKDIPVIRYLFSTQTTVKLEREVILFVRPLIVEGSSFVKEREILQKYESGQDKKEPDQKP